MTESVIQALRTALQASPRDEALLAHLVQLLLDGHQGEEALQITRDWLSFQPTSTRALVFAIQACEMTGEFTTAQNYQTLLNALSAFQTQSPAKAAVTVSDQGTPEKAVHVVEPSGPRNAFDDLWDTEPSTITLADVAGMQAVKDRIHRTLLGPLRNPELTSMYGKSLRGGMLLYGPPGCGKTYLAKAIAGEMKARFLSISLTDVLDMYIGQSEHNLKDLFDSARRRTPCVIFFDEMDALGRKRSLVRNSNSNAIHQLLMELDGKENNDGLFVLAATNAPWDVDAALRRPGRLDRTILVLPPDREARKAILEMNFRNRPTEQLDLDTLAAQTEDFSGADLKHLCDTATDYALSESLNSGTPRPIRRQDLMAAFKEVRPSTREWFELSKNFALYANENGLYDDLEKYLKVRKFI
ncbi:ATP-binding protein [Deinococcus cellulosilyticus]|uniref:Cell division cycle protein 48 n=1 Tax=Deinococcus cellulosilyticus (strain DSM 18568 / NBRC 106333 / KACC 11606 / 5516J-15) TaxID=1223518 RepID=A0A511MW94_DEIC1|nr:ATP-binding protein [Deinococcus cellulosilyticus]GEM44849.1 cell division cycle protein 48 [Deinococcus cellulosilyticus NBRC 106333 = KACC 11606]